MSRSTTILSVDPSPRGTAVAVLMKDVDSIAEPDFVDYRFFTELKGVGKKLRRAVLLDKVTQGDEEARLGRLYRVESFFCEWLDYFKPDYVAMEDYAWTPMVRGKGKKKQISKGTIQIGEIGGALRLAVMKSEVPLRTYEPSTVKLAWAGKGNAKKEEVTAKAVEYLQLHHASEMMKGVSQGGLEGVADALAVGWILCQELMVRAGTALVRDFPPHIVRVFNRVTKAMPVCLVDRPFVQIEGV